MKRLLILPFLILGLVACEKDDTTTDDNTNNNNNNNNTTITNNTLTVGSNTSSLNLYTAYLATDVNTNLDYYTFFIYKDDVLDRKQYINLQLKEIPSASKTLDWQSGSSAPGDLTADQFALQAKVNDEIWYGEYTVDGWATTGTMQAVVSNGKLTLWWENIELADNFITPNVTSREKCSGKLTFNLSDLQSASANTSTTVFNLTDE